MKLSKFACGTLLTALVTGCGSYTQNEDLRGQSLNSAQEEPQNSSAISEAQGYYDENGKPVLARSSSDREIDTLTIPFSTSPDGLALANAENWQLDMEDRAPVKAFVSPKKHLIVRGALEMNEAGDGEFRLGCIEIELYDNVNYREDGWLRIATTGISGTVYEEVKAPLYVDFNPYLRVPELNGSLDLATFEGNSVKSYKSTQCFMIDLSDLPAQEYQGEIIVQYLKEDLNPTQEPASDVEGAETDTEEGSDSADGSDSEEDSGSMNTEAAAEDEESDNSETSGEETGSDNPMDTEESDSGTSDSAESDQSSQAGSGGESTGEVEGDSSATGQEFDPAI